MTRKSFQALGIAVALAMGCGGSLPGAMDPVAPESREATTNLGSEILLEFRALTTLLTPGLLLYLVVVVVAAFAARRGIGVLVKLIWRFGGDPRRRLARIKGSLDLVILFVAAMLALRPLFAAVPLVLSVLLSVIGLIAAVALPEWIQNFAAGLSLTMRAQLREGDQVEVGEVSGAVERIGMLRTRLSASDDRRVSVPNRDILRFAVRVGGQRSAISIEVDIPDAVVGSAAARHRIHCIARLSPFRRAGTAPRLEERGGGFVLSLQTWSTADPGVVRDALEHAIAKAAQGAKSRPQRAARGD